MEVKRGMTTILQLPSNLASELQGVDFIDLRTTLPVNPNYTWAELVGTRPVSALNTIVLHHDGIPKAKTVKYTDVELASRIARDHITSTKHHPKGDPGFPYDLWIRNGALYWCNDVEQREYGVGNNNGYTVNVCVSGEYKFTDVLTDDDRKALYVAILMLQEALPNLKFIKGHGEISPTYCPGFDVEKVRKEVVNYLEKQTYVVANTDNQNLFNMLTRIRDLQLKLQEPQYAGEARRKLLLVHEALNTLGFYK